MSDMRELGERFLSNTCCRNYFENHKNPPMEAKEVSMAEIEGLK
jgi:hypothetical protein